MLQDPLTILDFEATGLRPEQGDRITEVGLVRVEDGRITARFQSLVNCGMRIPPSITAYTGITQQMVDEAPPARDVLRKVLDFVGDTAVVAHNAGLDQRLLQRECRQARVAALIEPFICSLRLARRLYPHLSSHSLGALARALNLPGASTQHRAAADAEVTAELMLRIGQDIAARHAKLPMTTWMLRGLMHTPVAEVTTRLERLCA
jgi:DNA polymerase-3 subunit epsilon